MYVIGGRRDGRHISKSFLNLLYFKSATTYRLMDALFPQNFSFATEATECKSQI